MITKKGIELARLLGTPEVDATSLIARHAKTYARIQEAWCSVEMSDRQARNLERKETQLEARIKALAASIGMGVVFGGDPRGYTVKIQHPDGRGNTWGKDGIGVPGS